MNSVRLVSENGVSNIQKKLWYVDNSSEINLDNFEAGDRIYSINDNKLFQIEYDTSSEQEYSGEIVSFEADEDDRISSLEVEINPVQDLHGYDNPWPAGGGKNLFLTTATSKTYNGITFIVNSDGTINVNGTATAQANLLCNIDGCNLQNGQLYVLSGCPSGGSDNSYALWLDQNGSVSEYGNGTTFTFTDQLVVCRIRITSGTVCNNLIFKPMVCLATAPNPTVFAPYANECPISGHTGLTVGRVGKNWLAKPFTYFSDTSNVLQDCFFVKAGSYLFSFLSSSATSWRFGIRMIDANGTLLSSQEYNPNANQMFWNTNNNMWLTGANGSTKYTTITIAKDCYIRIVFALGDTTASSTFTGCQLELGSTQTDVEPYTGTTIPISWQTEAGTVYEATLDAITGKLYVSIGSSQYFKTKLSAYSAKIENINNTGYTRYQFYPTVSGTIVGASERTDEKKCSIASYLFSDTSATPHWYHNVYGTINLFVPDDTDENTEAEFIIPLVNPIEYTITTNELNTLYGTNNIWTDAGEINVKVIKNDITAFELGPHV